MRAVSVYKPVLPAAGAFAGLGVAPVDENENESETPRAEATERPS